MDYTTKLKEQEVEALKRIATAVEKIAAALDVSETDGLTNILNRFFNAVSVQSYHVGTAQLAIATVPLERE